MKNKFLLTILLVGGLLLFGCDKQPSDRLIIDVTGLEENTIKIIEFYSYNGKLLGSTEINHNGKKEFLPKWEEPQIVTIYEKKSRKKLLFVSEKGNVKVHLSLKNQLIDFEKSSVEYTKETENVKDFTFYKKKVTEFNDREAVLYKKWQKLLAKHKTPEALAKVRKPLDDAFGKFSDEKKNFFIDYVKNNTNLISQYIGLTDLRFYYKLKGLDEIFNRTPENLKKTVYFKDLKTKYNVIKNLSIGAIAPNIISKDVDGKDIDLYSLRGKYVLLDFWASWCSSCRKENPYVKKAYQKYKKKGLVIFAVSLDYPGKKKSWLKAIEKDGLQDFYHASLLKGWKDPAAKTYNLTGIPSPYLISPEGKILAKGYSLREEKLFKMLEKHLK